GCGETGEDGRALEREILATAREGGLRIVGPNTDGAGNLATGALATIQPIFGEGVEPGRVAVVTQSGATAASLIRRLKEEGIGTRLYASAGNEIDLDRKSTRLNSSHVKISYAVFCLKEKRTSGSPRPMKPAP